MALPHTLDYNHSAQILGKYAKLHYAVEVES